jgi:hypothetical protein
MFCSCNVRPAGLALAFLFFHDPRHPYTKIILQVTSLILQVTILSLQVTFFILQGAGFISLFAAS